MPSKPDLHSLAQQAHDEVRRTGDQARRASGTRAAGSGWRTLGAWLVLVGIVVFSEMHITELEAVVRNVLPGHAAKRKQIELERVLVQARDALEAARDAAGALPEALPHAALASVVRYERGDAGYRLVASSGEVTVALDDAGNREVTLRDN
jgi:hypothetical protein